MKKLIVKTLTILLLLTFVAGCSADITKENEKTVTFLTSLDCEKCEAKFFKNIPHEPGIVNMKVNVPEKLVTITFNEKETNVKNIIKIFNDLGYDAEVKK